MSNSVCKNTLKSVLAYSVQGQDCSRSSRTFIMHFHYLVERTGRMEQILKERCMLETETSL